MTQKQMFLPSKLASKPLSGGWQKHVGVVFLISHCDSRRISLDI